MESGDDPRLKPLLNEWQVPNAPGTLEQRVFNQRDRRDQQDQVAPRRAWWRVLVDARVRVPLPVALAFSVALIWLAVIVARDRTPAVQPLDTIHDLRGFQPVNSVNVRVERSSDATR